MLPFWAMSLEEYAAFRAALMAEGEENMAVLRRYAIPSMAVKVEIQEEFARRFRADAALQARFVELLDEAGWRGRAGA